jgi:hypothetical protein
MNSDGLYVKYGLEEGKSAVGGEYSKDGNIHEYEVTIDYTEVLSATAAIVDGGSSPGPLGVVIPEGLRITEVEVYTATAFTSSGTIGSATLVMGLKKKSDRSTELDHDGFTTSSFVGGVFDAVGETTIIRTGTTGAGAYLTAASTVSEDGVFVAANSAHASHPFTAGKAIVKIRGYYP